MENKGPQHVSAIPWHNYTIGLQRPVTPINTAIYSLGYTGVCVSVFVFFLCAVGMGFWPSLQLQTEASLVYFQISESDFS